MKKHNVKDVTMNESDLQRVYNYPIYPKTSKMITDTGFVNVDNGSQGGTHWVCFLIKDEEPFYFDSFGGAPHKFLFKQLSKPIIYHIYKIQGIKSILSFAYTSSI